MKKITAFLISTAVLAVSPALAQTFEEWDADEDGVLSEEEWSTGFTDADLFNDWDADDSGAINSDEFGEGLFWRFDDDGDGVLTQAEWDEGFDTWYGETAVDLEFGIWDADGDGVVSQEEFVSAYNDADLFTDFTETTEIEATEDGVAEDDFIAGLFDWFDADDDTGLIADEAGWFG